MTVLDAGAHLPEPGKNPGRHLSPPEIIRVPAHAEFVGGHLHASEFVQALRRAGVWNPTRTRLGESRHSWARWIPRRTGGRVLLEVPFQRGGMRGAFPVTVAYYRPAPR